VLAAVPAAPARSRSGQRNGRRWELSGGLGSRLGGCPATVLALCGDQRDLDKGDGVEQLGAAEEWPALGGGRPHPYVGVARQTGIGRTGGRTRAADHGTWRDNFDAPRCGGGLGRRGASGCGPGARTSRAGAAQGAWATSRRTRSHSDVDQFWLPLFD
jgi:hypothetical protein